MLLYAELDAALRLNDALEYASLNEIRTALCDRLQGLENLEYCLLELRLICIACNNGVVNTLQIGIGKCHFNNSSMQNGLFSSSYSIIPQKCQFEKYKLQKNKKISTFLLDVYFYTGIFYNSCFFACFLHEIMLAIRITHKIIQSTRSVFPLKYHKSSI